MFGIGMPELIVILVIALIVLGPHKLPEIAKSLGKSLAEFKRASEDFRRNIDEEANAIAKAAEPEKSAAVEANPEAVAASAAAEVAETPPQPAAKGHVVQEQSTTTKEGERVA